MVVHYIATIYVILELAEMIEMEASCISFTILHVWSFINFVCPVGARGSICYIWHQFLFSNAIHRFSCCRNNCCHSEVSI